MKIYPSLISLLVVSKIYAQSDSIPIDDFHRITIEDYFNDSLNQSFHKSKSVLIIIDLIYPRLPKNSGEKTMKYFNSRYEVSRYMRKPFIKNRQTVYRIYDSIVSPDTIDILITQSTYTASFRHLNIAVACGGTIGYIPEGRFVNTTDWKFISGREISEQKARQIFERRNNRKQ